jgi:hypothetical protein
MLLAKWLEQDRVVEIIKVQFEVKFSEEKGWILINLEPGDLQSLTVRWLPVATTRFEWAREFRFPRLDPFAI